MKHVTEIDLLCLRDRGLWPVVARLVLRAEEVDNLLGFAIAVQTVFYEGYNLLTFILHMEWL